MPFKPTLSQDFWKFFIYNRTLHNDTKVWNIYLFTSLSFLSFHHWSLHPPAERPGWPLAKSGHPSLNEITTRVESNYPTASALFVSFSSRPCHDTILNISPLSVSSSSVVGCTALLKEGVWMVFGYDYCKMLLVLFFFGGGVKKKKKLGVADT